MMRIGIDVQTLSTYEGSRGIGRLCYQLIAALKQWAPENPISLFGLKAEPPPSVRCLLGDSIRYCRIRLHGDAAEHLRLGCSAPFLWTTPEAREIDLYHVTSPLMPDILLPLDGGVPVVATLLDAIPAVMRERGQPVLDTGNWAGYMVRRNVVARFQHFLPISDSAAQDCARTLDLPEDDMTVTYVPIDQRPGRDLSPEEEAQILGSHGLTPGYVVSVTGFHERKNILGTLNSFASMSVPVRQAHRLVLVCALQDTERAQVMSEARRLGIQDRLVLTGFVNDRDLVALVRAASAMIFASRYEGFGIPVAEAMALGVPVVASDASSLPEVVGDAGIMQDPDDHTALGRSLERVLQSESLRVELKAKGFMQVARFSPEAFVERLLDGYRRAIKCQLINPADRPPRITTTQPLRVAVFSPLTPCMSGVADYTEQLLLHLGDLAHCECFIEKYRPAHHLIRERFDCREHSAFCARHAAVPYDAILYQVGNNILHAYTLPYAERYPGAVVFHDFSLLGVYRILAQRLGGRRAVQERFADEYPDADAGSWEDDIQLNELPFSDYHMTGKLLDSSRAVVVHSQWLAEQVRQRIAGSARAAEVHLVPLGVSVAHATAPRPPECELRRAYLVPSDAFVIAAIGGINRHKRVYEVLEAFEMFHRACPNSCFLLVGHSDRVLRKCMEDYTSMRGIKHCVRFLGRRDTGELYDVLAIADVCVNLRYPTMGESSATLMNIMAMGKPALVTPMDQFCEFPDDVCWKVTTGAYEKHELVEYFMFLREHPEVGRQLGSRARDFVAGSAWEAVAKLYLSVLQSTARDK